MNSPSDEKENQMKEKELEDNRGKEIDSQPDELPTIYINISISDPPIGESLAKLKASLAEYIMAFSSIVFDFSPLLGIQKSLITGITQLAKLNPIADQMAALQKQVNELFKGMFEGLGPILEQVDQRYWAILPYLKQTGFVLSPSTPISLLTDIEELVNNDCATVKNVCKVLVDISEMENHFVLIDMIKSWKNVSYFANRAVLLDDALDAHINGKYSLSIPAMIPLIEGFFNSCFEEQGKKGLAVQMKEHFDSVEGIDEMIANSLVSVMEEYLFHTAYFYKATDRNSYLSFKASSLLPPDQILNRHGILHGFDYQYISIENSLRVFFTIDSLIFMIQQCKFG